mgnify:CR=1 FL=1
MENKKLEEKIECIDYKKEDGKCFHLGIFSGRCFKSTNPLLLCKEVEKGIIKLKE